MPPETVVGIIYLQTDTDRHPAKRPEKEERCVTSVAHR
jgi:hypothetical protein